LYQANQNINFHQNNENVLQKTATFFFPEPEVVQESLKIIKNKKP